MVDCELCGNVAQDFITIAYGHIYGIPLCRPCSLLSPDTIHKQIAAWSLTRQESFFIENLHKLCRYEKRHCDDAAMEKFEFWHRLGIEILKYDHLKPLAFQLHLWRRASYLEARAKRAESEKYLYRVNAYQRVVDLIEINYRHLLPQGYWTSRSIYSFLPHEIQGGSRDISRTKHAF